MNRVLAAFAILLTPVFCLAAERVDLHNNWAIRSVAEAPTSGAEVSDLGYRVDAGWYAATVPTTVLNALVENRVYADPYSGMNLRDIAGTTYPIGANFSKIPMPPGSPFRNPWWYRTTFTVPQSFAGKRVQLHFDGINFRAEIWLNGKQIANSKTVAGAWRLFQLDVTDFVNIGAKNGLAVKVFPPTPEDLAITFVDWNPSPADKGMGLWRDVYLTATGPVSIQFPQVVTSLDLPRARLRVSAELRNWADHDVSGDLVAVIGDATLKQRVTVPAGKTITTVFTPERYPELVFAHPKLWWPLDVGDQPLYQLSMRFADSDSIATRFGIREVTSEVQDGNARLFKINGKNILIRGAGYSFDMLLRESPERERQELEYVRHMHLNAVRLEGKLVDEHFLELADEYGILITAGWCCCDHWEQWPKWDDEDWTIAAASLRDQIRRLRAHPSVFNWMNGSDNPPPPDVERMYISILKEENWPNPFESSATARPTSVSGKTGVKMSGPYDWVPPDYWLRDTKVGGAHGFNSETSPGPAIPPMESLQEMFPSDKLWPINPVWAFHAGGGPFRHLDTYTQALAARYGAVSNVEDYSRISQAIAYDGERAMFEAYARNKYKSTGVIQWMLNNAWPSVIWHLYDYYLRPGGGYFGTRKACEPLHVQYSYDNQSVAVVNAFYKPFEHLRVTAAIYDVNSRKVWDKAGDASVAADSVMRVFAAPKPENVSGAYFLKLRLSDERGNTISENFYWLSTKEDQLNWDKSTWWFTPQSAYADLHELRNLAAAQVGLMVRSEKAGDRVRTTVHVKNTSDKIAFQVRLKATRLRGDPEGEAEDKREEILPILWSDNYISLLPGEERDVEATYSVRSIGKGEVRVSAEGWNTAAQDVPAALPSGVIPAQEEDGE